MPGKRFLTSGYHWGVRDSETFWTSLGTIIPSLETPAGIFSSDALVAWGRNLGFLDDIPFVTAWQKHADAQFEKGIIWRTAILVWAARQALRRGGGIVECGCYAGTSMRIVMDAVDFRGREVFLYDLFEHDDSMGHHAMPRHGPDLYDEVRARFATDTNVTVVRGGLPDSFSQGAPDKIAFAHIDLNNAPTEIATLEALESRFVPGAVIVLDDFGQLPYYEQHIAERHWFAERGIPVLESPTGQGVVIW